jgi:hypothetical protein
VFSENGDREGKLSFADRSVASGEGIGGVCRFADCLGDADFRDGLCSTTEEFADPVIIRMQSLIIVSQSIGIICIYLEFALQTSM